MLTQDFLKKQFVYDPDTGHFYRRLVSDRMKKAGKNGDWYCQIRIQGKFYLAHRLAWLYVHGEMPTTDIDHINGIKNDNRIANLRLADDVKNKYNEGARADNKSGYRGSYFNKRKNQWMARAKVNGVRHFLGYYDTAELANEAYKAFAQIHHGEFFHSAP